MVKIFVGNLSSEVRQEDVRKLFEKFGIVQECDIIKNYGFVHMENERDAENAVKSLNGFTLHGRTLSVEYSTTKVRREPGMGGKDSCFHCGRKGHRSSECPNSRSGGRNRTESNNNSLKSSIDLQSPMGYMDPSKIFRGDEYGGAVAGRPSDLFSPQSPSRIDDYRWYQNPGSGPFTPVSKPPSMMPMGISPSVEPKLPPLPTGDRELDGLIEQYLQARDRYMYLRDVVERRLIGTPGSRASATSLSRSSGTSAPGSNVYDDMLAYGRSPLSHRSPPLQTQPNAPSPSRYESFAQPNYDQLGQSMVSSLGRLQIGQTGGSATLTSPYDFGPQLDFPPLDMGWRPMGPKENIGTPGV